MDRTSSGRSDHPQYCDVFETKADAALIDAEQVYISSAGLFPHP